MLEPLLEALAQLLSWPSVLYLLLGTLFGLIFGVIPGLGGTIALVLLLPLTFGMDSQHAIVLLSASLGGVAFGGSISAILINTPGTAPNAATCLDGYPMAKQGRTSEALGISATSSALGAIFGLGVLVMLLPFARGLIMAFSPPEFFWLTIVGLAVIATIGRGNFLKGLISAGIGLLVGLIGYFGQFHTYRFGFGTEYFWSGVDIVPAIIGLFALAEVIKQLSQGGTISPTETTDDLSDTLRGVRRVFDHPKVFLQSSLIGTIIGMVPGAGGAIANFVAYSQAQQRSDHPEKFGTGYIEGVIGAEAANDAKDGGSLLPTIVFGIPGSVTMVVLLGGFLLHGIEPGTQLLTEDLHILFLLILALLVSNILTSVLGLTFANYLAELTQIPVKLFAPIILFVSLTGAYAINTSIGDVLLASIFGLIGFAFLRFGYSRIAMILGIILAPIAEESFHQTVTISDTGLWIFFTRPISAFLVVILVLTLVSAFRDRGIDIVDTTSAGDGP